MKAKKIFLTILISVSIVILLLFSNMCLNVAKTFIEGGMDVGPFILLGKKVPGELFVKVLLGMKYTCLGCLVIEVWQVWKA